MKKFLLGLFTLITFSAFSHNVTPMCWDNGHYSFNATNIPTGVATVRVYDLTNHFVYQFNVTVAGTSTNFSINQPVRTIRFIVVITWSDNWPTIITSGTNQCTIAPIVFGKIDARNVGDNTVVTLQIKSSSGENEATVSLTMSDGKVRDYLITFPDAVKPDETWQVTINYKTGIYTTKRM